MKKCEVDIGVQFNIIRDLLFSKKVAAKKPNMYPWYRDSVSQLGQFCAPGNPMSTTIKTENGYNDCMLALDYAAQTKVSSTMSTCGDKFVSEYSP